MTALDLIARRVPDLVPLADEREPLWVVIASLALGGAERIVVEWLGAALADQPDSSDARCGNPLRIDTSLQR